MFRYLKLLTVFLLFFTLVILDALAGEILTWEGCVEEAAKNHPNIISASKKIKQSQADKAITKSNILPRISSNVTGQKKEKNTTITDTYSYALTGKQLLFDGFKTSNDIASASRTLTASEYSYSVVSSNIRLQLREAFTNLLRAQELLSLTESIAKRRRQNLELVTLRYEGGREHKGALLTAEADLSQADFEVSQAKRNIELSQRKLIKELGRRQYSTIKAAGNLKAAGNNRVKPDFESLAENTPFLIKLINLKEAAQYNLKSAKADFFPKVYFDTSIGKVDSDWPPGNEEWSVGLSLTFPLFEGGKRIAETSKAKSLSEQAHADERSGRDEVIYTLAQTWTELQDTVEEQTVKEKFLQAAEERAKIANAQYSTGLISFDDWIIIEDNLVTAQKSFLNARTNVLTKEAYWVQAKGGTLDYD